MQKLRVNLIRALTGAEALEKTKGKELALAILDVRMPGMDGYDLATLLNAERKDARVPIIFITAYPISGDHVYKAYGSGAVDYLSKPISNSILLCKINVFIDLFNQKRTIIKDAGLLRRSAFLIDETRIILKKTEDIFQKKTVKASAPPETDDSSDRTRPGGILYKQQLKLKKHKEDLNKAIVHAEISSENYEKAYDFSPSGYFTLSMEKEIQELNQSGARLLEKNRNRLINADFGSYITPDTKTRFDKFFSDLFSTKTKQECEVILQAASGMRKQVHIEGIITGNGNECLITVVDVTLLLTTLDSLKEEQLFSRSLVNGLPGIFFVYSYPELSLINWNKNMETLLGYNPDELSNLMKMDWVRLPDDKTRIVRSMKLATELGFQKIEASLLKKTGEPIPFILTSVLLENSGQKYIVGFGTDITEEKIAKEQLNQLNQELESRVQERTSELLLVNDTLRQANEKFSTVANFTHDWEFWIDPNENFLFCSPSCEKITGYGVDDFMQDPHLFSTIIYPRDLKHFQASMKSRGIAMKSNQEIEYRIVRKDGTVRWVGQVTQLVFNSEGEFIGIRGSSRDITARKKMENQLRTSYRKYQLLSENITDGIFICQNGCFEYVNNSMGRIFGFEKKELNGYRMIDLVNPDLRQQVESLIEIDLTMDQVIDLEIECYKKDRSVVFIEMIFNKVSKDKLIYGVAHDITDKKEMRKNVVEAIIQTEENERANFSKELHDGLGPLLSAIKLYLQWSLRPKSEKSREEIILKAEDILEESLATVKEISNKLSPHLLNYYGLTSAIQSFTDKIQETSAIQIDLRSNITRRFDQKVEAALYRAIIECVNNTIKHASAKNIYIELDDADSQLNLRYRDNGTGFELRYGLSGQKGLGLFNLQNRIQTIGGKINLYSKPGYGVDYRITLNL